MRNKGLFKFVSVMITAAIIISLNVSPAFAKIIPGTGLAAYDPMNSSGAITVSSGSGWKDVWTKGGTGNVLYNSKSGPTYVGYTATAYLNMPAPSEVNRTISSSINATVQPVWVSFLWMPGATANSQGNYFSLRRSNETGGYDSLFSGKMKDVSGTGTVIIEKGTNSADTGRGISLGTNFVVLKLEGRTVTAYINPVIADIDFTSEATTVESIEAQYDGTDGKPVPAVLTVDDDLIVDNIFFKAASSGKLTQVRVGFDAMSVARFTVKTLGTPQIQEPDLPEVAVEGRAGSYAKGNDRSMYFDVTVEPNGKVIDDSGVVDFGDGLNRFNIPSITGNVFGGTADLEGTFAFTVGIWGEIPKGEYTATVSVSNEDGTGSGSNPVPVVLD